MPTVAETLHGAVLRLRGAAIDDARIEAEVLLSNALACDRSRLYAMLSDDVSAIVSGRFERMMARRISREPLAYITGRREFYGMDVICRPGALIPRPETEMLVEYAIARCAGATTRVADVGTGTGAIAVAVATHLPAARVTATDTSPDSLSTARLNIAACAVGDQVRLSENNLLEGEGVFDLILANLPYVSEAEWRDLQPEVRDHEPKTALVPGPEGTEAIARLLESAPLHLAPGGALTAEIGATQGAVLLALSERAFPRAHVYVEQDHAGHDRMLVVET